MYMTRSNSAFKYDSGKLIEQDHECLWANPPFSQLDKLLVKAAMEPTRLILVSPHWPGTTWSRVLEKIAIKQFSIPTMRRSPKEIE